MSLLFLAYKVQFLHIAFMLILSYVAAPPPQGSSQTYQAGTSVAKSSPKTCVSPKNGKKKKVQGVYCTLSGFHVFFGSDVFTSISKVSTFLGSICLNDLLEMEIPAIQTSKLPKFGGKGTISRSL